MTIDDKNNICKQDLYIDEYILILYSKDGCEECIHKLYNQHHRMIANYCIKKFGKLEVLEHNELIGECYTYFLDTIRKFDIDKGYKFSTFLYKNLQQISRYVIQYDNVITKPADYRQKVKKGLMTEQFEDSVDIMLDTSDKDRLNYTPSALISDAHDPLSGTIYDDVREYRPEIPVNDYINEVLEEMCYDDRYSAKIHWGWGASDTSTEGVLRKPHTLMTRIATAVKAKIQFEELDS